MIRLYTTIKKTCILKNNKMKIEREKFKVMKGMDFNTTQKPTKYSY